MGGTSRIGLRRVSEGYRKGIGRVSGSLTVHFRENCGGHPLALNLAKTMFFETTCLLMVHKVESASCLCFVLRLGRRFCKLQRVL